METSLVLKSLDPIPSAPLSHTLAHGALRAAAKVADVFSHAFCPAAGAYLAYGGVKMLVRDHLYLQQLKECVSTCKDLSMTDEEWHVKYHKIFYREMSLNERAVAMIFGASLLFLAAPFAPEGFSRLATYLRKVDSSF